MEPLVYRPSLDRPFGKSRITRAVMSITDSAVREALRTEVSAEFFTTPQKYLLGADEELFEPQLPANDDDDQDAQNSDLDDASVNAKPNRVRHSKYRSGGKLYPLGF